MHGEEAANRVDVRKMRLGVPLRERQCECGGDRLAWANKHEEPLTEARRLLGR